MWKETDNSLEQTYSFRDFETAMAFMQAAVPEISRLDHHPEWKNVYNKVEVVLKTHSAGNRVTEKDRELAGILDRIHARFAGQ